MEERGALSELSRDSFIVIKCSDKGGLIVVQDASAYEAKAAQQLSDSNTYIKLRGNPTQEFKEILCILVQKGVRLGILSKNEGEALVPEFPIFSYFSPSPQDPQGT